MLFWCLLPPLTLGTDMDLCPILNPFPDLPTPEILVIERVRDLPHPILQSEVFKNLCMYPLRRCIATISDIPYHLISSWVRKYELELMNPSI